MANTEINGIVVPDSGSKPVVHEDLLKIARQQVLHEVMTFANAAERTAVFVTLVITPNEGAFSYLQDVDRFEVYNGGWIPLDYQETVDAVDIQLTPGVALYTTSGATELDLGRLAHVSVPWISGQFYTHKLQILTSRSVAAEEYEFKLRDATPLSGTIMARGTAFVVGSTAGQQVNLSLSYAAPATKTTTVYLSVVRSAGTGAMSVYGTLATASRSESIMTRMGRATRYRTIIA